MLTGALQLHTQKLLCPAEAHGQRELLLEMSVSLLTLC